MSDYRALYRKWRPVDFDDVSGQKSITDILKYEVANDKISHAYLFCGSRGTGKTSCAKILAKAVNCLSPINGNPCNKCEACLSIERGSATDVIEMDAASNNGVNNVRDMKDEIAFTPAALKYRVYIIDEVHMMSGAAFNALLKTLEEPPAYVVFILATTEFNKLPTTIVSRCQRFDFRRMTSDVITARLMKIASAEGIDLREDGARVIARAAQGGMRDAVSLLELCAGAHETVDAALVFATVGTGNRDNAYKLIEAVLASDFDTVYSVVADVVSSSADLSVFWQDVIDAYRDMMVAKSTANAKNYLDLTDIEFERLSGISSRLSMSELSYHVSILESALVDMQRAGNSKRAIAEIALTRMCDAKSTASYEALALRVEELERALSRLSLSAVTVPAVASEQARKAPNAAPTAERTEKTSVPEPVREDKPVSKEPPRRYAKWGRVVERIGELKRSLSVQFISSDAYSSGDGEYTIYMSPFFATKLSSSPADLALLSGAIAAAEGVDASAVRVIIRSNDRNAKSGFDDLDKL